MSINYFPCLLQEPFSWLLFFSFYRTCLARYQSFIHMGRCPFSIHACMVPWYLRYTRWVSIFLVKNKLENSHVMASETQRACDARQRIAGSLCLFKSVHKTLTLHFKYLQNKCVVFYPFLCYSFLKGTYRLKSTHSISFPDSLWYTERREFL